MNLQQKFSETPFEKSYNRRVKKRRQSQDRVPHQKDAVGKTKAARSPRNYALQKQKFKFSYKSYKLPSE